MPKLTDTQLIILTAAAQRDDGTALPLPKTLKIRGGAVTKTLASLLKKGLLKETPAPLAAAAWREGANGRRLALIITKAGLGAIGVEPEQQRSEGTKPTSPRRKNTRKHVRRELRGDKPANNVRRRTKQALLIDLLNRKSGATIDQIVEATGWQPHSVRGAISGTLKKKLGLAVASEKVEGRGRVYRISQRS